MAKPIISVTGSKGGVGKSIVSMAVVHYLKNKGEKVLLVEADTTNPDVWKCYRNDVECERLNLDEKEGWMDLTNLLAERPEYLVVINTPARSTDGVNSYGALLTESLPELQREMVTLWVINSQRDSLELLKQYLNAISVGRVHVLRNLYHGPEKKFELYNNSKIRESLESRGGKSLNFPEVADRISDQLHSDRRTIQQVIDSSPIGNRAEVNRWVRESAAIFDEVMG
jgi:hypothetical protein